MDSHRAPRHVLVLCFGAIACSASTAHAQAPGAPAFEVASIKENQSASDNASVRAPAGLARNLAPFTGRPIVDKADLTGVYDIDLTWTPEQDPSGPDGTLPQAPPSSDGVSLFTAVQEQLGLKLDPRRGPVDVLVIESVERPVQD
jgi:Protein of unknown function (DUF3738)